MAEVERLYKIAIALDDGNAEAHDNLGSLYEDQRLFKEAGEKYRIAAKLGLDAAYNNLARLYILKKEYSEAVSFLLNSLELAVDDDVKYDMLKNL